jgi:hypothetical protein
MRGWTEDPLGFKSSPLGAISKASHGVLWHSEPGEPRFGSNAVVQRIKQFHYMYLQHHSQSDLIGRIFRLLGECLLCAGFLKITEVSQFLCEFFSTAKVIYQLWQKTGLGYLLGDFYQTHLVTLATAFIPRYIPMYKHNYREAFHILSQ